MSALDGLHLGGTRARLASKRAAAHHRQASPREVAG